jgi:N-acetylmuramic acid 6-phosphate etherase
MLTEQQNLQSMNIDTLTTLEMLQIMNDEDTKVALAIREALPQISQAVDLIAKRMRDGGRLIYIGAGTSGRLGILDAVECVPTFSTTPNQIVALLAGGRDAMFDSIEGAEDDVRAGAHDLSMLKLDSLDSVVGIAASGKTPYVLGAIAFANQIGTLTIGLACNTPSPLLDAVQIPIGVPVGPEVITGSTRLKAGSAQKMALNMISTGTMIKLGKVYGNLMVDVQPTNTKLVDRARRIVMQISGVDYEQSSELLAEANGEVKPAIVMAVRSVSVAEAQDLLQQVGGHLRKVIG